MTPLFTPLRFFSPGTGPIPPPKPAAEPQMIASKLLAKELKAKLTLTTCEDVLNEIPGF